MRKIYMNGSYKKGDEEYLLYAISEGSNIEIFITDMYSHIKSAYKTDKLDEYSYLTSEAKELWKFIKVGLSKCSTRRMSTAPVKGLGTVKRYNSSKGMDSWYIDKYDGQFSGCEASGTLDKNNVKIYLTYTQTYDLPKLDYVKLTNYNTIKNVSSTTNLEDEFNRDFEETIPVRSLAEISLEKDTTWLNNKHYYIVNDENQAEQIFSFLENYNGIISYDTETTGLCINMFGEIGSERKASIDAENIKLKAEGKAPYKVDRLVGIIFCVEENVSYYFPCFNRKFKNLYSDKTDKITLNTMDKIMARYTIGDLRDSKSSMANYIRNTPKEEWQCDVILMERVRDILEKKWIGTHHGSFEYKVGLMYSIDTNLKDDSMILHQLLYKFRNITASNDRGEPSNLKYLTKVEFGIDQLDLKDFFVDYSEDESGLSRQAGKKGRKGSNIDFSYMDYDGSKAYAPADGDFTLGLILKYKNGLLTQFKNQEYLYNVEILVSCAIGYMEYYGHRLDEAQIEATKINTYSNMLLTEKKIRDLIDANTDEEKQEFECLIQLKNEVAELDSKRKKDKSKEIQEKYVEVLHQLDEQNMLVRKMIDTSVNQLNLGSPQQVGELFYDRLGIPVGKDGTKSVNKRAVKPLAKAKDENMNLKYPVVKYYMDWKNDSTLLTKFFDNLPNFMYPGGFIFSGYGQISTATGRMSCVAEGSKISIPGGTKNIEDIKVGDYIYCYDDDGNLHLSRVRDVLDNGIKDCLEIKWRGQRKDDIGSIVTTPDHLFRTRDLEWVEAQDLIAGDSLLHLRFTKEDRPRYLTLSGDMCREQDLIKCEYFNCNETKDNIIHHKDEIPYHNNLDNLELMTREEHSRLHGKKLALQGKIKTEQLRVPHKVLSGSEHPNYKSVDIEYLEKLIRDANGIIKNVDMDFDTFKKKCNELNFDYKKIASEYRTYYIDVDDETFIKAYNECNGIPYAIHKKLGLGRTKVDRTIERLGLEKRPLDYNIDDFIKVYYECNGKPFSMSKKLGLGRDRIKTIIKDLNLTINHKVVETKLVGKRHVYDLVVDGYHNFIANEINLHNCSKPNAQQYPHSVTCMVIPRDGCVFADADYSQIEYRTLTAMANEKSLKERFEDPDMDYHTVMASLMFDTPYANVTSQMRSEAKTFNFGIPYGMGLKKLAFQLKGSEDAAAVEEAKEKYELYFKEQPNVRRFFDDVKEFARVYNYTQTKWGRRRYFSFNDENGKLDTRKMGAALRQAGNAIIQGTAADIFKIGAARNFLFLRENKLFGKYFITNMVHDEQLVEISCDLNVKVILANLIKAMELRIDGFPPLFVGAGIGATWDDAKGKMAEIHPLLGREFVAEVDESGDSLYATDETRMTPNEVYDYFAKRNYKFREQKILNYILDENNYGETLHPIIGSTLVLQFDYGVKKELKERFPDGMEGITYTKEEKEKAEKESPLERLRRFIEAHGLDIPIEYFKSATTEEEVVKEEEEEEGYNDGEEEDDFDLDDDMMNNTFKLIDESAEYYGCSLKDLINEFGFVISKSQKVVGIAWNKLTFASQKQIQDYLNKHLCDETTPGAYRVVLLNKLGQLKPEPHEPQLYVHAVTEEQFMSKVVLDE